MQDNDFDDIENEEDYNDEPTAVSTEMANRAAGQWNVMRANITKTVNTDGTNKIHIKATKACFVSALIHLDGKNFNFKDREYLEPVYNRCDSEILLKNARQTEKSTFLSNNLVINSVVKPFNKSLYVSPSHMQTRQFSSEKLKPILDRSPMINTYFQDSSVSAQVFEKGFLNGSFIFLRSAFRSADRCLPKDAKVILSNGTQKLIEHLQLGEEVLSFNETTTVANKVIGKEFNGKKSIGRLTLTTGHELESSHNHRFQTDTDLKRLDDLTTEDYIPIPFDYLKAGESRVIDTWMGLMLSDGCMINSDKYSRCSFNNNNKDLIDLYEKLSSELGLADLRPHHRTQLKNDNYTVTVRRSEDAKRFLDQYSLNGVRYDTKFLPQEFFENRGRISTVLRAYYEGNGWITTNEKSRQCEVGVVTGSKEIADAILWGLQSLGIYAIKETWLPGVKSPKNKHTHYCIKIRNTFNIKRFSERVGFIFKQHKLNEAISFINTLKETSARDLDVPARDDCAAALKKAGISSHSLWTKHQISFRNNAHTKKLVATHKVEAIYNLTKDPVLKKWLDPNVLWVNVKEVELGIREEDTYDIEIENNPIFCAEGIFCHNTRGVSARNLCIDEIQDALIDQIPVIRECTSHFPDSETLLAGTPKSLNNPIEVYWLTTTQNEWLLPCKGCGKWNFLDERNIAPTEWYINDKILPGPVCKYCGHHINPKDGQWVSMCPDKPMKGYRIPQLMVPWICNTKGQWLKLLWKRDNYPISQFYNEVLGISYDSSSAPITQQELVDICGDYSLIDLDVITAEQVRFCNMQHLTAGVDWGEGLDGAEKGPSGKVRSASYTILTIGYYHTPKQYKVIAIKKFTGKEVDPDFVVKYIAQAAQVLGIGLIGVDWGHGWGVNNTLIRLLGGNKVIQFQHLPKLKLKMKWDPIGFRYHLMRNFMMSELFYDMKNGALLFPKWKDFEPYSKDILAIYTEYNEFRREIKYDHRSANPDDFFHSLLYAKLIADIQMGRANRFTQGETGILG